MPQRPADRLYHLLPQIYRRRDAEQGHPLRALLGVIESEFARLETDIGAAYDDWFIETCNSWVIPYLADLVGITDLTDLEPPYFGQRRRVANHIAYQRRKGRLSVLAHIARDVSDWPAFAVESARLVAQTMAPGDDLEAAGRTFNVQAASAALVNTPFDDSARTLHVSGLHGRTDRSPDGIAALRAIALYLWRLRSYPLHRAQAGVQRRITRGRRTRHFSFDPLGRDRPLFIYPEAIAALEEPLRPIHFPHPLTRGLLVADLAQINGAATSELVGPARSLAIWLNDAYIRPDEMVCGELNGRNTAGWLALLKRQKKTVVVDPENGRLLFAGRHPHGSVAVRYAYGSMSDVGSSSAGRLLSDSPHLIQVTRDAAAYDDDDVVGSLAGALARWREICDAAGDEAAPRGTVRILDSAIYTEPLLTIPLPNGSRLTLETVSGERPTIICEGLMVTHRAAVGLDYSTGETEIFNQALTLSGILLDGSLAVASTDVGALSVTLTHCTLTGSLTVEADAPGQQAEVVVAGSVVGGVTLRGRNARLHVRDSILDPGPDTKGPALQTGRGARTTVERSTLFGDAILSHLTKLADSLVIGTLDVASRGDDDYPVQHSYFRTTNLPPAVCRRCVSGDDEHPLFTSRRPVDPGYAQLAAACPRSIREGGHNGSEMGVSSNLDSFRREQNLQRMRDEYLPLGHALGIFYAT